MTALDKLIEAVEADVLDSVWHGCSSRRGHWAYATGLDATQRNLAWQASHGSLDAALALHEAVLPGWGWGRYSSDGSFHVTQHGVMIDDTEGKADAPARAWLLAILRAYRSVQA